VLLTTHGREFLSCGESSFAAGGSPSTSIVAHILEMFFISGIFLTFLFTPVKLIGVGLLTGVLLKRPSLATRKNQRLTNGKVGI